MKRQLAGLMVTMALLLGASTSTASAQRGGMGGMGRNGGMGGRGGERGGSAGLPSVNEKDVFKLDPARVFLDKAKDFKLNDAQKQALDSAAKRYEWNVHVSVRKVDSLNHLMMANRGARRDAGSTPSDSTKPAGSGDDSNSPRHALRDELQFIRGERDAAEGVVLRVIQEGDKSKALPMLSESRQKLEDILDKVEFPARIGG